MSTNHSSAAALAARLRNLRLLQGFTQADLAGRAGISRTSVQQFERDGALGLDGFLRLCDALGLGSQVALVGTLDASVGAGITAGRKRGRRHAGTAPKPAATAKPSAARAAGSPARATPASASTASSGVPATPADPAAVERTLAKNRTTITWLLRAIVSNRLTNFTAGTVCRTMLKKYDLATRAEIVAAVEAILRGLNPDTASEYGIGVSELNAWQPRWQPNIAIAHAIE